MFFFLSIGEPHSAISATMWKASKASYQRIIVFFLCWISLILDCVCPSILRSGSYPSSTSTNSNTQWDLELFFFSMSPLFAFSTFLFHFTFLPLLLLLLYSSNLFFVFVFISLLFFNMPNSNVHGLPFERYDRNVWEGRSNRERYWFCVLAWCDWMYWWIEKNLKGKLQLHEWNRLLGNTPPITDTRPINTQQWY